MKTIDNAIDNVTVCEWMDLEADGALAERERTELEKVLAARPELAMERRALEALHALFEEARIAVRPGFRTQLMAALPRPTWRRSEDLATVPAWGWLLAAMLAFALGAAWLLTGSGVLAGSALGGTAMAVVDLAASSVLAGSGLLFATWRGVGFGLGELLGNSYLNLAAFALLVICLDLLFVSMLRRPATVTSDSAAHDSVD